MGPGLCYILCSNRLRERVEVITTVRAGEAVSKGSSWKVGARSLNSVEVIVVGEDDGPTLTAVAAIQMSLVGIGVPARRRATAISA